MLEDKVMKNYARTVVSVSDFRLRNLNFIPLETEASKGFLNRAVTQPSLSFWRKTLWTGHWTWKAQRKVYERLHGGLSRHALRAGSEEGPGATDAMS